MLPQLSSDAATADTSFSNENSDPNTAVWGSEGRDPKPKLGPLQPGSLSFSEGMLVSHGCNAVMLALLLIFSRQEGAHLPALFSEGMLISDGYGKVMLALLLVLPCLLRAHLSTSQATSACDSCLNRRLLNACAAWELNIQIPDSPSLGLLGPIEYCSAAEFLVGYACPKGT